MKPLEIFKLGSTLIVAGSIFLALQVLPIVALIAGASLFVGGVVGIVYAMRTLTVARTTERWKRVFGRSNPTRVEVKAWRAYMKKLQADEAVFERPQLRGVSPLARCRVSSAIQGDARRFFLQSTVPMTQVPRRKTARPLIEEY